MGKLIVLEWKKNRAGRYGLAVAILTVALALFLFAQVYLGIANDPVTGVPDAAPGTFNISSQVELVSNVTFLVFTCGNSFIGAPGHNTEPTSSETAAPLQPVMLSTVCVCA